MDRHLAAHDERTQTSFPHLHHPCTLHTQAHTPPHADTLQTQHGPLHAETHRHPITHTPCPRPLTVLPCKGKHRI